MLDMWEGRNATNDNETHVYESIRGSEIVGYGFVQVLGHKTCAWENVWGSGTEGAEPIR